MPVLGEYLLLGVKSGGVVMPVLGKYLLLGVKSGVL